MGAGGGAQNFLFGVNISIIKDFMAIFVPENIPFF
jgi:hypothetical protein